jgi:hypothetical protein
MQKFLLVNLNNTSTKLALADSEKLLAKKVIPTKTLSILTVKRAIGSWRFDHALVGSVVPKKNSDFSESFPYRNEGSELGFGAWDRN